MNPHVTDAVNPIEQPCSAPPVTAATPDLDTEDLADDDFQYNPIPPRRVVTILIRYELQGPGQPLPYDLDEEVSE